MIDFFILVLFIFLGLLAPRIYINTKYHINNLQIIWLYHLSFGILYFFYVGAQGGSDSLKYWIGAKQFRYNNFLDQIFDLKGTKAMYLINYIPSNLLNLSFFSGTIIYCFLGFIGLTFFYLVTIKCIPFNYKFGKIYLFPFLFYFPNLHFWSSAIGKDTLLFFSIGLFTYSLLSKKIKILHLLFSIILSFIIRPHILLFLLLGFSIAYLFNKSVSFSKRYIFSFLLIGVSFIILPIVLKYVSLDQLSMSNFVSFSESKADKLSRSYTNSSVNITKYPFIIKVFTFLYRPTFFDIQNFAAFVAAIENFILLLLTFKVVFNSPIHTFIQSPFLIKGLFFFLIIGTLVFSFSLGNLGIMLRMRNMFLPGMMLYIMWSFSFKYSNNLK